MAYVVVQIPCLNEEGSIATTLNNLPKSLPRVSRLEVQIIDDGCTDRTVEVARECGVDHVVTMGHNQGLAKAYLAGMEHALALGADVIVNTDADNQYHADDIEKLVSPILEGRADIVVGGRPIASIGSFSPIKKLLQHLGSWVVRQLSGTEVADAPSGFRALSHRAAKQLNVYNAYTYTLETLIQAGQSGLRVNSIPIRVNGEMRPSRLVRNIRSYVSRSVNTILRAYLLYRPMHVFTLVAAIFGLFGSVLIIRFFFFYFSEGGAGLIQSVVIGSGSLVMGLFIFMVGLLADLISINRRLLEDIRMRVSDLERAGKSTKNIRDAA